MQSILLMCLSILSLSQINAQVDSTHIHLLFPGAANGLDTFYKKLHDQQMRPGKAPNVNILHIGGSHIQAGTLTNTVRMRFEPSGCRGLLFPFRAIRTNSPQSYRFDYTGLWRGSRNVSETPDAQLGLAGAAAITSDKEASITLHLRDSGRWDFRQLVILGETSDPSVSPFITTQRGDTVWADPIFSIINDVEGTWNYTMYMPDSVITLHFKGLTQTISPKLTAKQYFPMEDEHYFVLRGIIPQTGRTGITYQESGINGASLPSWLRCSDHFEQELSLISPDLAIFGIGINDANVPEKDFDPEVYKSNYRKLIDRIRTVNPRCSFIWITNNDCAIRIGRRRRARYNANKNTPRVQRAMMELAQEYNGAVFDVFALMGGMGSANEWIMQGLMQRDHIHFTVAGYQVIGNLLYDAIEEDYRRHYPIN